MLPSNAFYECITGSILIKHLQGVEMAKNKVKIDISMYVEVSDDYLKALQNNLMVEVLKHCFRNHNRKIITETMEVLKNETV